MPRKKEAFEAMRESTRQKIEAAALSMFARKGLSVTIDEIARTAGLSKGLLYNHYTSKDALIMEFVKRANDTSGRLIKEIAQNNAPAIKKIQQITSMMCQMFTEQPMGIDYFMFMIQVDLNGFQVPKMIAYTEDSPDPIDSLASIIEQGQREGTVVNGDTVQLSTVYWATIQGLCCYAITGKYLSPDPRMLLRILLKESCL